MEVIIDYGIIGVVNVFLGVSIGSREVLELRDKGIKYENNWFGGKGVMIVVDNVNEIIVLELEGLLVFN